MTEDFIHDELRQLRRGDQYRQLRLVEGDQGPVVRVDGREVLNFCSNNYLGLANHPRLREAAVAAIERYGCGSGASRLISGNMELHEQLEARLAALKRTEAALLFNSGFQANTGIIPALVGSEDLICSDALNHASVIDGCRLARARTVVYGHCDLNQLEDALKRSGSARRKLVVTESVFSMDGDQAPLVEIVELAERYNAMVMVDEAHATGVFEPDGAGLVSHLGLGERVLVQMGTLGKALGAFGAYVAGSRELREFLINRCRSFIYTTSLPPAVAAMAIAAIDIALREPERRRSLRANAESLRIGLERIGFSLGTSRTQILPVIIGDAGRCMTISEELLRRGVFAQGIRPPTVPPGTARLRVTVMATHTPEQIERAIRAFEDVRASDDVVLR